MSPSTDPEDHGSCLSLVTSLNTYIEIYGCIVQNGFRPGSRLLDLNLRQTPACINACSSGEWLHSGWPSTSMHYINSPFKFNRNCVMLGFPCDGAAAELSTCCQAPSQITVDHWGPSCDQFIFGDPSYRFSKVDNLYKKWKLHTDTLLWPTRPIFLLLFWGPCV